MSDELSGRLLRLAQSVRDGRGAFLADAGGILVASAGPDDRLDVEAAAAEYVGLLGEAASMGESRGWGRSITLTVQGATLRLTAAATPTGLLVGLVGGPESLTAQMRRAARAAASDMAGL
jgi:predicted regulator of Ras-like GTPase activity (Roadblock/LC7/MglB family)